MCSRASAMTILGRRASTALVVVAAAAVRDNYNDQDVVMELRLLTRAAEPNNQGCPRQTREPPGWMRGRLCATGRERKVPDGGVEWCGEVDGRSPSVRTTRSSLISTRPT